MQTRKEELSYWLSNNYSRISEDPILRAEHQKGLFQAAFRVAIVGIVFILFAVMFMCMSDGNPMTLEALETAEELTTADIMPLFAAFYIPVCGFVALLCLCMSLKLFILSKSRTVNLADETFGRGFISEETLEYLYKTYGDK